MSRVRVGVVGVGVMGDHHARIYSTLKDAKLVGVYDGDLVRGQEVAAKYGCPPFSDLESLCASVDALSVATPTSTHFPIALTLLRAGKHLLIEKPLTLDPAEAQELCQFASNRKLVVSVGMIERFNPAFIKAASMLKKETILGLTFNRYSPYPNRIFDASVVMDMMIHDIDLALALAGADLDSVKASGKAVKSPTLDEVVARLYFKDGLIAKLRACRLKESKERSILAITDRSVYEIDLLAKTVNLRSFASLSDRAPLEVRPADQLTLELKDFISAVKKGREPEVPCSSGLRSLKVAKEVERLACL